jgi:hypothetical protein
MICNIFNINQLRAKKARLWSNRELRKIVHHFQGEIVNVSAWDDRDKEGGCYKDYFINAREYYYTNYPGEKGYQQMQNEYKLDLSLDLPRKLYKRFDVAYNHTTLEHIYDAKKAFQNLCLMSRDVVIIVVPFAQVQHETGDWKDFWRFTPTCLRYLFHENGFKVIYESESKDKDSAIYLLFVATCNPEKWTGILKCKEIKKAGYFLRESFLHNVIGKIIKLKRKINKK